MRKFDDKADTEVTGHAILLGITILGISMISIYGIPVLQDLQDISQVKNVEESFTVFDSRASKTALGEAPLQMTDMNLGGGSVSAIPDSSQEKSYMVIKRTNETTGAITETFNISMGKIVYKLQDREVAYEGGGVWSKYSSGSVMLSPPEFHYNGETLTLPIMNISTSVSSGGEGNAGLSISLKNITRLYPENGRVNPVIGDKVYIIIYSEYYDAWASFLSTSEFMDVKTNLPQDGQNSVNITLLVVPKGGTRALVPPIRFRGINPNDPDPLENFYFNITDIGSNMQFDLRAPNSNSCPPPPSAQPSLDIQMKKEGGGGTAGVRIEFHYYEGTMQEFFESNTTLAIFNNNANLDLLNSSLGTKYKSSDASWTWNPTVYTNPNPGPTLANVTQHYISLIAEKYGGSFELQAGTCTSDQPYGSNKWPGSGSTYTLDYDSLGGITFLHITRNDLTVWIK